MVRARAATVAWLLLAGAVVGGLAWEIWKAFKSVSLATTYGTAWMPYSDALGPWLQGGLSILFGLPPPDYLYRPTIGVFWGSLLGAAGHPAAIPAFFSAWLLAFIAFTLTTGADARARHAMVVGLGVCALGFATLWRHVFISSLGIDFASLVFTLTGATLVLAAGGRAPLLAGCVCLGIAAAVRGPMALAGPLLIAARVLLIDRQSPRALVACAALFAAPLVADLAMQRWFGVVNNALPALFCVYSDPTRTWTGACHAAYLSSRKLGAQEVLGSMLAFLASQEGRTWLLETVSKRIQTDFAFLASLPSLALALGAAMLSQATVRPTGSAWPDYARSLLVVGSLGLARASGMEHAALAWVIVALATAAALRSWRAASCLAAYLAGTLFVGTFGLLMYDRLQHTFSFLLFVGAAFLLVDDARPRVSAATRTGAMATATVAAAIAFLYLGVFLPSTLRDSFLGKVHGRDGVALKLGADPRIDRSLYLLGDFQFVFTRHDGLEIGAVRPHRGLVREDRGNGTFEKPNAFAE